MVKHRSILAPGVLTLALLASCGGPRRAPESASDTVIITVIGTNDVHGHVRALPVFGGYLRILRELRENDGGAVVLLDGGDMFQGTLESNLLEGAPIVEAYGALGYDAVTIGNHEFDYGPAGEHVTPSEPGEDPRGALLALAAQADYPFLSANLLVAESGAPIEWERVVPSVRLEKAGLSIGVIGVTTEDTLRTTNALNVSDLAMAPLAASIEREATALREAGASIVLVTAHAGGLCTEHHDPRDLSSCESEQEIFQVAEALDPTAVDGIVAGHTHQAVSHFVSEIPVIESYAYGRAFGRIDLVFDRRAGRVVDARVHAPRELCARGTVEDGDCEPGTYEGRSVEGQGAIVRLVQPSIDNAAELRARPLGVTLETPIARTRVEECPLGNLFTDLMRTGHQGDLALTNGGGLRADLPEGPLTYGALYAASPFDNLFARVRLTGGELRTLLAENLQRAGSFYSVSGVRAQARCQGGELVVSVAREDGRAIADDEMLNMITTDFLANGAFASFSTTHPDGVVMLPGEGVRDVMARVLTERGGTLRASALHDPATPRVRYEGERPVSCAD